MQPIRFTFPLLVIASCASAQAQLTGDDIGARFYFSGKIGIENVNAKNGDTGLGQINTNFGFERSVGDAV